MIINFFFILSDAWWIVAWWMMILLKLMSDYFDDGPLQLNTQWTLGHIFRASLNGLERVLLMWKPCWLVIDEILNAAWFWMTIDSFLGSILLIFNCWGVIQGAFIDFDSQSRYCEAHDDEVFLSNISKRVTFKLCLF